LHDLWHAWNRAAARLCRFDHCRYDCLKARGVVFEHYDVPGMKSEGDIAVGGGAKAAWFKDSEGNILALIQSLDH
jgi:hypothetical protein